MDPFASSLQVPDPSLPGPSRQQTSRPVSVQPTATVASPQTSSTRKRASHTVVTSQPQQDEQPSYRDIYSHPAALEYAAAHPRRTIPKFGPYLLLQTLGEGEFGKVKLGLHMQWGEEVAVKLIRRGNIDTTVRMSKVEREISVLRTLKHPNIVRLYDVIETDKYIGIILEYASGGELFDHILAHRYLREKDACKLFSQLISGVWYIHQKKIVHRDLKLENLLLDRHRNVIITDFGFANHFEHRSDDLMQTSCGSPCYAAPELVISDGLYVGSAVDVWSCGVILYAMLAGYLPFDDDPANPDGDNINLLYKYIVNTPLSFPEYISAEARDLLSIMLVPDPTRRADLTSIMQHPWLAPYAHQFTKTVADLEHIAVEQHHQKRLAYQRQMKQSAADPSAGKISRSHSSRTDTYNGTTSTSPSASRSQKHSSAQPEFLYETSVDQSSTQRRGYSSAVVLPSPATLDDDPFAPNNSRDVPTIAVPMVSSPANDYSDIQMRNRESDIGVNGTTNGSVPPPVAIAPVKTSSPESNKRAKSGFRHTIQVEYGEDSDSKSPPQKKHNSSPKAPPSSSGAAIESEKHSRKMSVDLERNVDKALPGTPSAAAVQRSHSSASKVHNASPPGPVHPGVSIEVTAPPATVAIPTDERSSHTQTGSASTGSSSSKQGSRHRTRLSLDKIGGITKFFGSGPEQTNGSVSRSPSISKNATPVRSPSIDTVTGTTPRDTSRRPSTLQVPMSPPTTAVTESTVSSTLLTPERGRNEKKSRRNTLTVMVEPFSRTIKQRKNKGAAETPMKEKPMDVSDKEKTPEPERPAPPSAEKHAPVPELVTPGTPEFAHVSRADVAAYEVTPSAMKGQRFGIPSSTMKANKVMQWFRSKSKGKGPDGDEADKSFAPSDVEPIVSVGMRNPSPSSSSTVNGNGGGVPAAVLPTPTSEKVRSAGSSLADRVRRTAAPTPTRGIPPLHHGAVDQTTITTGSPPEVMKHVRTVLENMGLDIQLESEFKYRCVRPKRRKTAGTGLGLREGTGGGLAAFTMVGSAASGGVDKRGLPMPSQSSFAATGGMLRGLLMRRQSSQVSASSLNQVQASQSFEVDSPDAILAAANANTNGVDAPAVILAETVYGDNQQDHGDEVRFSVELTRLARLDDTYSLDIRRLKGNLRSYKFLYDTLRQRADLQR